MFYHVDSLHLFLSRGGDSSEWLLFNNFFFMAAFSVAVNFLSTLIVIYAVNTICRNEYSLAGYVKTAFIFTAVYEGSIFLAHSVRALFTDVHLENWFVVYPPYILFILFLFKKYALRIKEGKGILLVLKIYFLFISLCVSYYAIEALGFYILTNDLRYQYIVYNAANMISLLLTSIAGFAFVRYVKKKRLWFEGWHQAIDLTVGETLVRYVGYTAGSYLTAVIMIWLLSHGRNIVQIEVGLLCLFAFFLILCYTNFLFDKIAFHNAACANKNVYIQSLVSSIDGFRYLKQDLNNMMQVYDGYMVVGDYDALQKYHKQIYRAAKAAGDTLEINRKMAENPALYSILLAKMDKAAVFDVDLSVSCVADASRIDMSPMDISRVIGILLDNAIEEAALTHKNIVYFSTQTTRNDKILVSISNPTLRDVDTKAILAYRYTTKEGHGGIGLYEVRQIVMDTPGCYINIEYHNYVITFYLELPVKSRCREV